MEHFDIENTFETKQELVNHSIEYGKMIIDGKIPGSLIKDN